MQASVLTEVSQHTKPRPSPSSRAGREGRFDTGYDVVIFMIACGWWMYTESFGSTAPHVHFQGDQTMQ
jgi:hypothetical protein